MSRLKASEKFHSHIASGLEEIIQNNILKAIELRSAESLKLLLNFMKNILIKSFLGKHFDHFSAYLNVFSEFTSAASKIIAEKTPNDAFIELCKEMPGEIILAVETCILGSVSHAEPDEKHVFDPKFCVRFYSATNHWLWRFLYEENYYEFERNLRSIQLFSVTYANDYREANELNRRQLIRLFDFRRIMLRSLKYWLYFQSFTGAIGIENALKGISVLQENELEMKSWLTDFLVFSEYRLAIVPPLSWKSWTDSLDHAGPYNELERIWPLFGFYVDLIRNKDFTILDSTISMKAIELVSDEWDNVTHILNAIQDRSERYLAILDVNTRGELDNYCGLLLGQYRDVYERANEEKNDQYINTPLKDELIQGFRELVRKQWNDSSIALRLFKAFGAVRFSDEPLEPVRTMISFPDSRNYFITGYDNDVATDQLRDFPEWGYKEDLKFSEAMHAHPDRIVRRGGPVKSMLDNLFELLERNEKAATVIIMDSELFQKSNDIKKGPGIYLTRFRPLPIRAQGNFRNTPVFMIDTEVFRNRVMVADFTKAFRLVTNRKSVEPVDILNVEISPIRESDAIREAHRQLSIAGMQSKTDANIPLWKLLQVKMTMEIALESFLRFEVIDPKSYLIGSIATEV